MENSFDVAALAAVSAEGTGAGAFVQSLRNELQRTRRVSVSRDFDLVESADLRPVNDPPIAFDPAAPVSKSRTIAQLDKFAERAEENRIRMRAHLQSLEGSVANVQRSKSFMLGLAER